ncbi:Talin-1 [Gaertneriomyces sp. JEL0708]|nr:Talin-1 [Gaertneriomyces sp. JEL0708]
MSHLSVKITVVGLGLTKTMQFSGDLSVHDVCREIREKFGEGAGGTDHGLLWPERGIWLQPTKLLDFYDLNSGDALEYRKKHRMLRVKTMDGSVKTVLVDESLPVQQLVDIICEKIGIANSEEYSILPENPIADKLLDSKGKPKDTVKAPSGKKGIYQTLAGDQSHWLHPEKTLREQGLTETDTVMLKKKFFFTDANIDRNDPVQLNLMYNQAKEMILSGKHPCTLDEAVQFGAIQLQVQSGSHEPDKHKSGFIKLKEFIPPEYSKGGKDLEKRIYAEHAKLQGLGELNAKFRYVQLSRSLKTYGITFFLVEDETVKKKKNAHFLLGVTKQSVVKLDPITKDILKEWRLTQLRRWAASPNSFTMDFGDYADAYVSVKTQEGEQISQLIAGYIDIIVKKKKEAEKVVEIPQEEQATVEDYVAPGKATNVGMVAGGARTAQAGMVPSTTGMVADGMRPGWGRAGQGWGAPQFGAPGGFNTVNAEISGAQQAMMQNISNGFAMVNNAAADMKAAANLPPLGNDAAALQWKQHTVDVNAETVAGQLIANLAAAGSLMNHATGYPEEMNYEVIGANIATLTSNLGQMAQGIKILAGLQESIEDQESLLAAGRGVAQAAAKLLEAAQPICMGHTNREDFFASATNVARMSAELLGMMGRLEVLEDFQNVLMDAARTVAKTATELAASARPVAAGCKDPTEQQVIVSDAQRMGEAAASVVACTSVVCPAVTNTQCLDQLLESAMLMREGIEQLVSSSEASSNGRAQQVLKEAAQKVEQAVANLIDKAKKGPGGISDNPLDLQHDAVLSSIDTLLENMDSVDSIVNGARDLTLISMQFVNMLKGMGLDMDDEDERARLLDAARLLGDATSRMVAGAKDAARNPNDPNAQARLQDVVNFMRDAANVAIGAQLRTKAFNRLVKAARDAIASSNQLISASRTIAQSNRNQASQLQLNQASKRVTELIPALSTAMKTSATEPGNLVAQSKLIEAAKKFIQPGNSLIGSAKVAAPTTAESSAQSNLVTAINQNSVDLHNLQKAMALAEEASVGLELESALVSLEAYQKELLAASANPGGLIPLEGYSTDVSQMELLSAIKALQESVFQLASGVQQSNSKIAGTAATDSVAALQSLSFSALALAASEGDPNIRRDLLRAANGVADALNTLLGSTKEALDDPALISEFDKVALRMTSAIAEIAEFLPGQRELKKGLEEIHATAVRLATSGLTPARAGTESFQTAQMRLQTTATGLTVAGNHLVTATRGSPTEIPQAVTAFTSAFKKLYAASTIYASATQDQTVTGHLHQRLKGTAEACVSMLASAKSSATDPSNSSHRMELMTATQGIGNAINQLLEVCSAAAPGHKECNDALQILNIANAQLDSVNEAQGQSQDTYGEIVAMVSASSKELATKLNALNSNIRSGNVTSSAAETKSVAEAVLTITQGNVRAAYLVATADQSSTAAIPPPLDQAFFSQSAQDVREACRRLINPANSQQEILDIAALIAKYTANLCNASKQAGVNPDITAGSKQTFIQAARDIAGKTSALVATIKPLAVNPSDEARQVCQERAQPLVDAVEKIVNFALSSEFGGTEAKVGTAAAAAQKPIMAITQTLIAAAQDFVGTVKLVCSDPNDQGSLQLLQAQQRDMTDAMQRALQTVSSSAPGQKECEEALGKLSEATAAADNAIMEATVNNLEPQAGAPASTAALADNVRAIASLVDVIAKAAKENASQLGGSATQIPVLYGQVTTAAVAFASNIVDMQQQMSVLEQVKALGDALNSFVYAAKTQGGNSRNTAGAKKVDEEKAKVRVTVSKLAATLEGSRDESGEFLKAVEQIEAVVAALEEKVPEQVSDPYHIFEQHIDSVGKQMVATVGDVLSKAKTPDHFRKTALQIAGSYDQICIKAGCAIRATNDPKVQENLRDSLRGLGAASIKLVEAIRHASGKSAADQVARNKLSGAAREVSAALATLMTTAKEGSKGLLQCQAATANINDIIGEFESTLIFAQAGQLDPVDTKDNFARHKDSLLAAARDVTEYIKNFITGVTGTQDELGVLATSTVQALDVLKNELRVGAVSITSADKYMQQQLLSAGRDVAAGMQALINTATNACGKPPNDPVMIELGGTVKQAFMAMTGLIRSTKTLGDEASRGIRAIEGAMAEVDESIIVLGSAEPAQGTALPDEVAGSAKLLATAAASLVSAASGKQEELVAAANAVKKQMQDLARAGKAATEKAPEEKKSAMIEATTQAGKAVKGLLNRVKALQESNTPENKSAVQASAKDIAMSVNAIVRAAESLIPGGYVDPNDPNVVAERELLAAAASIDAAARKLAAFVPAERPRAANEDLNFEEQILEAAKAIAAATAAVVRSATGAQRELVAKGKTGPREEQMYFSDGTWSDGLVSAAKLVAGATGDLCEAANQAVKGKMERERVIVAAKSVSTSTTQLLSAAVVRADPNSQAQIRLRAAGKAVTGATDNLVKAAEANMAFDEADQVSSLMTAASGVGGAMQSRVAEMEAQVAILKMEKELERARMKLASVRKGKYDAGKKDARTGLRPGAPSQ